MSSRLRGLLTSAPATRVVPPSRRREGDRRGQHSRSGPIPNRTIPVLGRATSTDDWKLGAPPPGCEPRWWHGQEGHAHGCRADDRRIRREDHAKPQAEEGRSHGMVRGPAGGCRRRAARQGLTDDMPPGHTPGGAPRRVVLSRTPSVAHGLEHHPLESRTVSETGGVTADAGRLAPDPGGPRGHRETTAPPDHYRSGGAAASLRQLVASTTGPARGGAAVLRPRVISRGRQRMGRGAVRGIPAGVRRAVARP